MKSSANKMYYTNDGVLENSRFEASRARELATQPVSVDSMYAEYCQMRGDFLDWISLSMIIRRTLYRNLVDVVGSVQPVGGKQGLGALAIRLAISTA